MPIPIPETRAPSEQDIQRLVAKIGAPLPAAYLRFVQRHDGAVPESNSFAVGSDNASGVAQFVPVADAIGMTDRVDGFPAGTIALAEDDCGNFVYVDPRTGEIFFWDHEIEGQDTVLAASLDAFLDFLTPYGASEIPPEPKQVISAWIDPDFLEQIRKGLT
jgi:hypothetical protein